MPVDHRLKKDAVVYQRDLYAASRLTRMFRDYLDNFALRELAEAGSVLDVGCGEGLLLEKIAAAGKDTCACGVDLCPENIEICRGHRLRAIPADAQDLPFADASFDACVITEVIEHMQDGLPQRMIREISRVLKKGGKAVVMFPNDRNYRIARILSLKIREAFYDMGHLRQWDPVCARRLLEEASFIVDKSFSVPFGVWPFSLNHIIVGIKR